MPQRTISRLINLFISEKKQKQNPDIMVILFTELPGVAFTALRYSLAWGSRLRSSDWSMSIWDLNYLCTFEN